MALTGRLCDRAPKIGVAMVDQSAKGQAGLDRGITALRPRPGGRCTAALRPSLRSQAIASGWLRVVGAAIGGRGRARG
ncbi:MAG: hypothetical protein ABR970_21530, partial [Roseiarcus sp.]